MVRRKKKRTRIGCVLAKAHFWRRSKLRLYRRTSRKWVPGTGNCLLLLFSTTGGRFGAAFGLLLCLGLFHGLFGFGGALGAEFGAFLALLLNHPLRTQQFNERLFGAVALLPAGAHYSKVAALAVAEAGREVEQLVHRFARH